MSPPYRSSPSATTIVEEPGSICSNCGVMAPARATKCEGCDGDLRTLRVAAPPHRVLWAALKAAFRCRSCDFSSPLDDLELDERVYCAQCGALQRLEVEGWRTALEQAHNVADLRWPSPEGRQPAPRLYIGDVNTLARGADTTAFVDTDIPGGSGATLEIEVAPGYPTCHMCRKGTLDVQLPTGQSGETQTRCNACGDVAKYKVAEIAAYRYPVVSPAARLERPRLRLETMVAGGPIALLCPRCGAPFANMDEQENASCSHCDCISYVPVRARKPRPRAGGSARLAAPFFVAFPGPSALRAQLESTDGTIAPIEPAQLDAGSARVPQILLALLCAGVALVIGFASVALTGLVDIL